MVSAVGAGSGELSAVASATRSSTRPHWNVPSSVKMLERSVAAPLTVDGARALLTAQGSATSYTLKAGSTWFAMPSRVRKVRVSKIIYGGVNIYHVKPISPKTAAKAPKRDPVSGAAAILLSTSSAMTAGRGLPEGW